VVSPEKFLLGSLILEVTFLAQFFEQKLMLGHVDDLLIRRNVQVALCGTVPSVVPDLFRLIDFRCPVIC
jgi:hypothetical protein